MQLSREVAMDAYESAVRKKHILAEHQREDGLQRGGSMQSTGCPCTLPGAAARVGHAGIC